jgi:hypothetical protein
MIMIRTSYFVKLLFFNIALVIIAVSILGYITDYIFPVEAVKTYELYTEEGK